MLLIKTTRMKRDKRQIQWI
uniref:Uncharacterized protein n=1 Tax=Arundo donax TaxID=35708 RepID=A0A0A8XPB3_ARUDO